MTSVRRLALLLFAAVVLLGASQPLPAFAATGSCPVYRPPTGATTTMRLAVLGDSIAQGYGTSDPWTCAFSYQIALKLPSAQRSVAIALDLRAQGGGRVEDLFIPAMDLARSNPDIVVVELGTNDLRWHWPPSATQAAYAQILSTFATLSHPSALSQPAVLCLSIWPSPGFDDPDRLTAANTIIQTTCERAHGTYVALDALYSQRDRLTTAASDGNWHPNTEGAAAIATLIDRALLNLQIFDPWCPTRQSCPPPLLVNVPARS